MPNEYAKNKDFILQIDLSDPGSTDPVWFNYLPGIQTLGESRSDTQSEFFYLDGMGTSEQSIDGTIRTFATTGHRIKNSPLHKKLFTFDRQWNTQNRYVKYRYFNTYDGDGEQGFLSMQYPNTQNGAPQERAAFGVTFTTQGKPAHYVHGLGPYMITYNPGTGTGDVTDSSEYEIGESAIVKSGAELTPPSQPSGAAFKGWNTAADGTGIPYATGDLFPVIDHTTLYAQYDPPSSPLSTEIHGESEAGEG